MTDDTRPPHRFLTVEQTADELNVGVPLIRAIIKSGDLRGIQVGSRGVWRIGRDDIETYIAQAYERTAEKIARGEFSEADSAET
ncbi:helix-turn-helix domain-containing protein [Arthrobacter sp. UYCo732]|uniref:helix-turn-helix domain-containing protein n=1 Tax=Arthrobacter sp. UYCo732 TaxID=3156336 RepID=UPI0033986954